MPTPKYVQRIARLPEVFEVLSAHPDGLSVADLAARLGTDTEELRTDLLAFYAADVSPVLLGLSRPDGIEFFGPDGEVDPAEAEMVRLSDERPGEEIGVEHVDAGELALVYTAATALAEIEPDNADLEAAIEVLTDAVFGEEKPAHRPATWHRPIEVLREAVPQHKRVRITYSRSWYSGVIDRVIDPYRLIQTRRGWEVDAGPADVRGNLRTYLVANIRTIELLDETYPEPENLDSLLAAQRATTRVRVRIPHAARWAADFHAETVTVVDNDEFTTTLDLELLPPVRDRLGLLLLAAGIDAQVLEPPAMITAGPELAARLLEHYRS